MPLLQVDELLAQLYTAPLIRLFVYSSIRLTASLELSIRLAARDS